MNRKEFLKILGFAPVAIIPGASRVFGKDGFGQTSTREGDELVLREGLDYRVLVKHGDPISSNLRFGSHNDFVAFHALGGNEALLWVNHEYLDPYYSSGFKGEGQRTMEQLQMEMKDVGGSIIHIKRSKGEQFWELKLSERAKRLDGTTLIPFEGGEPFNGTPMAKGTLANCSGAKTPWGTILSCEENYDQFYGDRKRGNNQIEKIGKVTNWGLQAPEPPENYGWVVEVDLKTGAAKKTHVHGTVCT